MEKVYLRLLNQSDNRWVDISTLTVGDEHIDLTTDEWQLIPGIEIDSKIVYLGDIVNYEGHSKKRFWKRINTLSDFKFLAINVAKIIRVTSAEELKSELFSKRKEVAEKIKTSNLKANEAELKELLNITSLFSKEELKCANRT